MCEDTVVGMSQMWSQKERFDRDFEDEEGKKGKNPVVKEP